MSNPGTFSEVLNRAADWLEAHPDKHITGALATTTYGYGTLPDDPQASCFCAAGRVAKEAGLQFVSFDTLAADKIKSYLQNGVPRDGPSIYDEVWHRNDWSPLEDPHAGRRNAIVYLRYLAEKNA